MGLSPEVRRERRAKAAAARAADDAARGVTRQPVRCNLRTTAVKRICSAWRGAFDSKIHSILQVDAQGGISR